MENKKIIYLGAYKAVHSNYNILYQDINGKRDLSGDMLDIDLKDYDVVIATPPCNYWSRANYRRETSLYAQKTKHLLNDIIDKCIEINKPFIVENVRNKKLMHDHGLLDKHCYIFTHGRHTYWTNVMFNYEDVEITYTFKAANKSLGGGFWLTPKGKIVKSNGVSRIQKNSQGGDDVYKMIERFLSVVL